MRTLMLIKKLLRDSNLSEVALRYDDTTDELMINISPADAELQNKIQHLLSKEILNFENNID